MFAWSSVALGSAVLRDAVRLFGREADAEWSSVLRFMPLEYIHRAIDFSPSVELTFRFTLDPN